MRKTTALLTVVAFAAASAPGHGMTSRAPSTQASAAPAQSRLQIQHDPLACVTPVTAPEVDALVNPGPEVAVSQVLWRAKDTLPYYYYVVMTGTPPSLGGVIPRVEDKTKAIEYYIQAVDRAQLSRKTPDYVAPVIATNVCKAKGVAVPAGGLGLTIGLTDKDAPPVPPGFRKEDIAKVILVGGAVVTLAEALQMMSPGGAPGGSAAAPAPAPAVPPVPAAPAGAAAGGGSQHRRDRWSRSRSGCGDRDRRCRSRQDDTATPTPTSTPTRTFTPTITPIPFQFIQVEATWSGPGDVNIQLTRGGAPVSGNLLSAGCDPTGSRTERLIVQDQTISKGVYEVQLTGTKCAGQPDSILTLVSVHTQPPVPNPCSEFVGVPTTGSPVTVQRCTFEIN